MIFVVINHLELFIENVSRAFQTKERTWIPVSLHLENSDSSTTMNLPVPRYFHAAAVHRHKMFVSGGFNGREYLSDMWQFDMLQGWMLCGTLRR